MNAEIFELGVADAPALAKILNDARAEYLEHFHPFPFTVAALEERLAEDRNDRYWGLRCDGALAGFFMLRGWDEGYSRPAFGVFVAEEFRGRGLARRALEFSIEWCRAQGLASLILTVHSANHQARQLYVAAGFTPIRSNPQTGHEILEKSLP